MKIRSITAILLAAGALSLPTLGQAAALEFTITTAPPPERVEIVPPRAPATSTSAATMRGTAMPTFGVRVVSSPNDKVTCIRRTFSRSEVRLTITVPATGMTTADGFA
jgi:hypothetical protein